MAQRDKIVTVGLGEILWDLLPEGKQLGGAPANFAYFAKLLGAESLIISAVGNDSAGREITAQLDSIGLSTNLVAIDPEHPTGTVSVKLNSAGDPDYIIHEEVAWDYIPFMERVSAVAVEADAICYGTLAQRSPVSRETIRAVLRMTKTDCIRVYDVNLRQSYHDRLTIQDSFKAATILKLNEDELTVIVGYFTMSGTEKEVLDQLIKRFDLRMIAVTKGAKGSLLIGPDFYSELIAPVVEVVDTVGAGDAFTAALAVGYINGDPVDLVHRNAADLAAWVCTQKGAIPSGLDCSYRS